MENRWYLGRLKGTGKRIYLHDFRWACGWQWCGGYIGNKRFHAHFEEAFLGTVDPRGHCLNSSVTFLDPWTKPKSYQKNVKRLRYGASVWESLDFFLDNAQYSEKEWWRIKDLFKQFYALKNAAEVLQWGGHCTTQERTKGEINKRKAKSLNKHIEEVIIPEIRRVMSKE